MCTLLETAEALPCLLISVMSSLASNKPYRRNEALEQKRVVTWLPEEKAPSPMYQHQVEGQGPNLLELSGGGGRASGRDGAES